MEPGLGQVVAVDVGANLDAVKTDFLAPLHLLEAQLGVLHRQGSEPDIVAGMVLDRAGDIVVEETGDVMGVLRFGPIGKEHGNGANDLHLHPGTGILLNADLRVPTVGLDFPEEAIALHHSGRAFFVMLEVDEGPVAQLPAPVRQRFGHDVGVGVNLQHPAGS